MEYKERIHREQGNYIVASGPEFEDILTKEPIIVNNTVINPGEMTDLYGWFTRKCRYVGFILNGIIKEAIFFMGTGEADLFSNSGPYYYDKTYIIENNRIGKCYTPGTFRDSYLRRKPNGTFYWK